MPRSRFALLGVAVPVLLGACWSRFGDLTDEAPVLMIDRPANVASFGQSMVAFDDGSLLIQRPDGAPAFALYPFGQSADPNKGGVAADALPQGTDENTATALGTVVRVDDFGGKLCYAGSLTRTGLDQTASYNILVGCLNDTGHANQQSFPNDDAFPAPAAFDAAGFHTFSSAAIRVYPGELSLASAPGFLVAGAPDAGLVWVSPVPSDSAAKTDAIAELPAPAGTDSTYGWAVAAVGTSDGGLTVATSDPTAGSVFLSTIDKTGAVTKGPFCVSGAPGSYGVTLHGYQDGTRRLLAIADAAQKVDVVDLDQVSTTACAPPTGGLVATLACVDGAEATGCDGGRFGFALAHGDLDGDGDQELLVGAPGMNVRDRGNAGAIYVYDLETTPSDATETLFLSYPSGADLLGKTVAALHEGDHDVVVATAEGRSQLAIFYCTALGGKGASSPRCAH